MKEKIYTIPLTDAFNQTADCGFCTIYDKLEKEAIDFVMGTSYMQDDVREQTNELGFCEKHLGQMYLQGNRLGIALMLQTHLAKVHKDLEHAHKKSGPIKKGLFQKISEQSPFVKEIQRIESTCFVCERIAHVFDRYIETFFYLLEDEADFKKLYESKNAFCLKHLGLLYGKADEYMKDSTSFRNRLLTDNLKSLTTLEEDLEWFVKKFDYRFKDESWKNSKDSIIRGIKKASSLTVKE